MTKMAKSPERNTFQRNGYLDRQAKQGLMDDPETIKMLEFYARMDQQKAEKEQNLEWQKDNLEYDLRTTDWILQKVRDSDIYAQNLYAAMCNNDFIKNEIVPILKGEEWSCSWRYAGGIIADMRETGDYIDWYCSGDRMDGAVGESEVTDEIREDLFKLGWVVKDNNYGLE